MQHHQENGALWVWATALEERERARREAMSVEEFGEIERERYDLDSAGITGEDNPETFTIEPRRDDRQAERRIDYRDVDPRFA